MGLSKTFETNQWEKWEGGEINAIKQRHLITALEKKDYSLENRRISFREGCVHDGVIGIEGEQIE